MKVLYRAVATLDSTGYSHVPALPCLEVHALFLLFVLVVLSGNQPKSDDRAG